MTHTGKIVMPTWRITDKQFRYVPSWMHEIPVRYTIPKLNGRFGLMKPQVPEGTSHAENHANNDERLDEAGRDGDHGSETCAF